MPGFGLSSEASHQTSVPVRCFVLSARCSRSGPGPGRCTVHRNASDDDGSDGDGEGNCEGTGTGMGRVTVWGRGHVVRRGGGLGPRSAHSRSRSHLREREAAAAALPVRTDGAHSMLNTLQLDNSTLDDLDPAVRCAPSAIRCTSSASRQARRRECRHAQRALSSELQGVGHWGWHRHALSPVPSPQSPVPSRCRAPSSAQRAVLQLHRASGTSLLWRPGADCVCSWRPAAGDWRLAAGEGLGEDELEDARAAQGDSDRDRDRDRDGDGGASHPLLPVPVLGVSYRLPSTGCPCLVRRGHGRGLGLGLGLGRGRLCSRGLRDASQTRRSCATGCWLLAAGSCAPGSDVNGTPRACTCSCSASEAPTATATATEMHSPANGAVRLASCVECLTLIGVQQRHAVCKLHATRPHFCTSALQLAPHSSRPQWHNPHPHPHPHLHPHLSDEEQRARRPATHRH